MKDSKKRKKINVRNKETINIDSIELEDIISTDILKSEVARVEYKRKYRDKLKSTVYIVLVICAVACLISLLMCPSLRIIGYSMEPTMEDGQIVVAVKDHHMETGELAGVYFGNKILVKRVIGTPGDWVDISMDGEVIINGEVLDEPYLKEKAFGNCDIDIPYQVPEKSLFVMGDNRQESLDSRNSAIGCVQEEDVLGKIFFRVWPIKDIGFIH